MSNVGDRQNTHTHCINFNKHFTMYDCLCKLEVGYSSVAHTHVLLA